jgi:hypothetical protein
VRFRVLDASTSDGLRAWRELWDAWPGREVMAHPDYARLFARPEDRVVCAVGRDDGGGVLLPLVLRPLAAEPWARAGERAWDATSPYGYGGPFLYGAAPRDPAAFWRAHAAWCADEGVVSTFLRLALFPDQLAPVPGRVDVRMPNVVVPLEGGAEALWRGYEPKVRKWVERARCAGVEVEVDRDGARLGAFAEVYEHTMRRCGADPWYFFPPAFFRAIVERLRGHFAFVHGLHEGAVVSSDLLLCSERHAYYFLGGTLAGSFPVGPNYLVKHRALEWALGEGKRAVVLGGGYATDGVSSDGLFRYKRAFARGGEVPFRMASLLHDERAYRRLVLDREASERRKGRAWAPRPLFFPAYRG